VCLMAGEASPPPFAGSKPRPNSYVLGDGIRWVRGPHFIGALFSAIGHHLTMKADNRLAAGALVGPRKGRMSEARN